jgi:hypothetical protein
MPPKNPAQIISTSHSLNPITNHMPQPFHLINVNARGRHTSITDVEHLATTHQPHVLLLTETLRTEHKSRWCLSLPHYPLNEMKENEIIYSKPY